MTNIDSIQEVFMEIKVSRRIKNKDNMNLNFVCQTQLYKKTKLSPNPSQ